MFEIKYHNGDVYVKEEIVECACCGRKTKMKKGTFNNGPYDFYGLPIGNEMEWFKNRLQFCPGCGYAYSWIDIDNNNITEEAKAKAKEVLAENIPDVEKMLKNGVIFNSIPLEDLYLYYEFTENTDKASMVRKELIEKVRGYIRESNELDTTHKVIFDNDIAISEIEWYRREGDFEAALKLCKEYKHMPNQPHAFDAPRDRSIYRKYLRIERRLCKHEDSSRVYSTFPGRTD